MGGQAGPSDEYTPSIIAPKPDGTSVMAWADLGSKNIRLASLTAQDAIQQQLPAVPGLEVHAMLADAQGAALAVMSNDPDIYSAKYCQSSATPDKAVCGKMDLVRIDNAGAVTYRTTLTSKKNVDSDGALFAWWYAHTARLATDGSQYAVYFRSAGSSPRPGVAGEIDIHAGDTLRFVNSSTGAMSAGGWDWGCSHSWSVRMAYNGRWGAACHGDGFPNAMQVARFSSSTAAASSLQWLSGTDPAQRALGGLVPATGGYWLNYMQTSGGAVALKLAKVPDSGSALTQDSTISAATGLDAVYPMRPYMAAYGSGKLLLGWKASGRLVLAVADATTGAVTEGPVVTSLKIDNFQDMVTAANGDVLWAYTDGGANIQVNRVAACRSN